MLLEPNRHYRSHPERISGTVMGGLHCVHAATEKLNDFLEQTAINPIDKDVRRKILFARSYLVSCREYLMLAKAGVQ
jgi:hypothetical protein